ncbi:MAG: class I SAM-dependent methyltransferase [Thermoguttaceae bacterium]|jgi:SAM-dependent methyltransferase
MGQTVFAPRGVGIELARGNPHTPCAEDTAHGVCRLQFIRLDLLAALAAEVDRWPTIDCLWLSRSGDPLAHPHYRQCLEVLYRCQAARRASVTLHTDGLLLRDEVAEAILDVPLVNTLVFWLDGCEEPGDFERRLGLRFDRYLRQLGDFAAAARQRRPELKLAARAARPASGRADEASLPAGSAPRGLLHAEFQALGIEVPIGNGHGLSSGDAWAGWPAALPPVRGGCPQVEECTLYFTVHGFAQPCRAVYDESHSVGRFPEENLGQLLNGRPMGKLRHRLRLDDRAELPFCRVCPISLSVLGEQELRDFWKTVDDRGELADLAERRWLFDEVAPTPHRVRRLDLGCGGSKQPGFVGADRFALANVDLVLDLDRPLPLADDTFDLVFASHSLEHVADLPLVMSEIYRVAKDGAQVCIIAPYYNQGLNLANPYHKQVFNEHTPRFWTNSPVACVDPADYDHPHTAGWGLADSDCLGRIVDLRCLRMEFFYFPEYRGLPPREQRAARKKYADVCDQIMYHLLVVKHEMSGDELRRVAAETEFFQPPYLRAQRAAREQQEATGQICRDGPEAASHISDLPPPPQAGEDEMLPTRARRLAEEVDAFRQRRIIRGLRRLRDRSDWQSCLSPAFQQLKDDSRMFLPRLAGYYLQDSVNLEHVAGLEYLLDLPRGGLAGLLLAAVCDVRPEQGTLGVRLLAPSGAVLARAVTPAAGLNSGRPARFEFAPIAAGHGGACRLQVFAADLHVPVRILEWRKYPWWGLRKTDTRPFCGLLRPGTGN